MKTKFFLSLILCVILSEAHAQPGILYMPGNIFPVMTPPDDVGTKQWDLGYCNMLGSNLNAQGGLWALNAAMKKRHEARVAFTGGVGMSYEAGHAPNYFPNQYTMTANNGGTLVYNSQPDGTTSGAYSNFTQYFNMGMNIQLVRAEKFHLALLAGAQIGIMLTSQTTTYYDSILTGGGYHTNPTMTLNHASIKNKPSDNLMGTVTSRVDFYLGAQAEIAAGEKFAIAPYVVLRHYVHKVDNGGGTSSDFSYNTIPYYYTIPASTVFQIGADFIFKNKKQKALGISYTRVPAEVYTYKGWAGMGAATPAYSSLNITLTFYGGKK